MDCEMEINEKFGFRWNFVRYLWNSGKVKLWHHLAMNRGLQRMVSLDNLNFWLSSSPYSEKAIHQPVNARFAIVKFSEKFLPFHKTPPLTHLISVAFQKPDPKTISISNFLVFLPLNHTKNLQKLINGHYKHLKHGGEK